ncbi:MAG: vitamin K epoxide reductase family protein [Nanoarchaeota archaeon]
MNTIQVLATIGILLSVYAYYVEQHARRLRSYKALCDFSSKISCTKVFTSRYSKILGVSNSLIGVVYYAIVFVLSAGGVYSVLVPLTLLGVIASIVLAYLSYFRLKKFCVVCTGTYVINIAIFITSILIST